MKSRITIEVDFDNGQPYIKVVECHTDDVRDKLIQFFRQRLGHTSSWLKFQMSIFQTGEYLNIFTIHPITPDQLKEEAKIMLEQADLLEKNLEQHSISH